jgi:septal ring factor EnvC (AmiA/AmiB activator)
VIDFDANVLGAVLGGAAATLAARFLGITQRMAAMERRQDTQSELVATQQQQISGLVQENREQGKKMAEQDSVIRQQARLIGDLQRENRELKGDCERLTQLHAAAEKRGESLINELWEERRKTGKSIPPLPGGG